jgi:hypothetical protein
METIFGLIVGIGLSAACGFRVFVPLLGLAAVIWICFKAITTMARSALFKKLLG